MNVKSELVQIPYTSKLTVDYIENELTKLNITPLRWAVVNVSDTMFTVSVANLRK